MQYGVLGPLEVMDDGRAIEVTEGKQRALLAVLLLNANRVVSTDRLVEALWDGAPSDTAGKAVQVYVSQLRKLLGTERLQTKAPGYLLRVDSDELDLVRFQRLVEGGDFHEALALWRGPPLAEFAQQFAQAEGARLEEMRLACLEERIETDLLAGRHAQLVGELEGLVAEQPLRQRLRGHLMLALYRSGRDAEALEAYQEGRRVLVDDLGIEPRRELRELQQAILRQDPSLELAGELEADRESMRGTMVGRDRELSELVAGLNDAIAGRGRLFLLAGEPGIGKSRLVDELIGHARSRGARVLVGRCWEAGGAPAYWPWVQSIRAYLRDRDPRELRAEMGSGVVDLVHLFPELRECFPDVPEPPADESEGARFRLFDATAALLRAVAIARPLVLVLDDLHAADQPSLLLLQFVARELADSRLLVLGAYRDVDPTLAGPLVSALTELAREPVTRKLELVGLSEVDVARFIELTTARIPAPELVAAVHTATDGNPLFVGEIARLLAAEGRLTEDGGATFVIPPSVKDVIGRRLRHLSEDCNQALTLASVLGREFEIDALAGASDIDHDRLLELLDEGFASRIIAEVPGAGGRLRFSHALIREALYERLPAGRRMRLHRQVAEALERRYTSQHESLAELAHHFGIAARAGSRDKAIEYSRRAGDHAAGLLAFEEAVRLYGMALTLTDDEVSRCGLLLALGDAQARAGDTPASKRTYRDAAELADRLGLPDQLARAALGYGGRIMWDVSRDDEYLVALLERALAAIGVEDSSLRVALLARLAGGPLRDARFPPERKAALSHEALEMARRIGDPATLAYALHGYILGHHTPEHTLRQLELATELVDVASMVGDKERALDGYEERFDALVELGQMEAARGELEAMEKLADELRQPAQAWLVAVYRALLALVEGRFSAADRLVQEALEVGEVAQRWNARISYRLQVYLLRRAQGRLVELEDVFESHPSAFEYPSYPVWGCVLARFYSELGRETEARQNFERLAADGFALLPMDEEWLVGMSFLAETAQALRDGERAARLYDLLQPYADRVAISDPEICTGSVSRGLGILAALLGRWDDAERHFSDALVTNERIGARPWLAETQEEFARMLLARTAPHDTDRAQDLLERALATYQALGMETYALRCSDVLDRL